MGAWLPSEDEVIRPIVPRMGRLANGQWLEVSFLLDAALIALFSARAFFIAFVTLSMPIPIPKNSRTPPGNFGSLPLVGNRRCADKDRLTSLIHVCCSLI